VVGLPNDLAGTCGDPGHQHAVGVVHEMIPGERVYQVVLAPQVGVRDRDDLTVSGRSG
jgi:hypothetical protein